MGQFKLNDVEIAIMIKIGHKLDKATLFLQKASAYSSAVEQTSKGILNVQSHLAHIEGYDPISSELTIATGANKILLEKGVWIPEIGFLIYGSGKEVLSHFPSVTEHLELASKQLKTNDVVAKFLESATENNAK